MSRDQRKAKERRDLEGTLRELEKLNKRLSAENGRLRRELQKVENIRVHGRPFEPGEEAEMEKSNKGPNCPTCGSHKVNLLTLPINGQESKTIISCSECGYRGKYGESK